MHFTLVSKSEREDFAASLKKLGYSTNDFELAELPAQALGAGIQAIHGEVIITRSSTKVQRHYRAGHGSSWPAEFEDDLSHRAFGPP